MGKRFVVSLFVVAVTTFIWAESEVETLARTERRFAQTSVEKGMKASFVGFLAEDSILFRPGPVSGKKWMLDHPAPPGVLNWTPSFAEVSSAGDLGFTTGPWEFRTKAGEEPAAGYGQFLSVWKKQPDGQWKLLVDCGIEYPKPSTTQLDTKTEYGSASEKRAAPSKGEDTALMEVDRSIQSLPALGGRFAQQSFLLRNGMMPVRGNEAIDHFLSSQQGAWSFQTEKAGSSSSGDLGYSYGHYQLKTEEKTGKGIYMRVWKWEGSWKLAADLILPES